MLKPTLTQILILTPIITALSCQFINKKPLLKAITAANFTAILTIALILFFKTAKGQIINAKLSPTLEFQITNLAATFLLVIFALKIAIWSFFSEKISKNLKKSQFSQFFSLISLNIFAIIGILLSNNLIAIIIFSEIYFLTLFALNLSKKTKQITEITLRQFLINAATTMLLLFCAILIYNNFHGLNLDIIHQKLLKNQNIELLQLISLPFFIAICVKFFSPLFDQQALKNNIFSSIISAKSLFLTPNLGIFLIFKLNFLFFDKIFTAAIIAILTILTILYSAAKILINKHLKSTTINFIILNTALIIISLAISDEKSPQSSIFYWFSLNFIGFFLYIFSNLLIFRTQSTSSDKILLLTLGESKSLASCLHLARLILPFFFALPFTFLFYGNYNLALFAISSPKSIAALAILPAIAQFALIFFALRLTLNLFYPEIDPDEYDIDEEPESEFQKYLATMTILAVAIYLLTLNPGIFQIINENFTIFLKKT